MFGLSRISQKSMSSKKGTQGSSSSKEVNTFPSSSRYARSVFDKYAAGKNVFLEKAVDLDYLRMFIPVYLDTLEEWGWTDYLITKKYVMPEVIRHFYFFGEDKIYDDEGVVVGHWDVPKLPTKLFNEKIVISADLVNEVVGVKVADGPSNMPKMNNREKWKYLKTVFKRKHFTDFCFNYVKASNLDVPERILHYVLAQSCFGRKRTLEVTDFDLYCMSRIMKKEPFNFGAFVILKMQEACEKIRGRNLYHCPFGKLITILCEHIIGVDRLGGIGRIEDDHSHMLRENINFMGFEWKGTRWVNPGYEELDQSIAHDLEGQKGERKRKRYEQKRRVLAIEERQCAREGVEMAQGEEDPISMASLMMVLKRIESNQVEMRTTIENMNARLMRMEERINAVDETLSDIEEENQEEDDVDEEGGGDDGRDNMEP